MNRPKIIIQAVGWRGKETALQNYRTNREIMLCTKAPSGRFMPPASSLENPKLHIACSFEFTTNALATEVTFTVDT